MSAVYHSVHEGHGRLGSDDLHPAVLGLRRRGRGLAHLFHPRASFLERPRRSNHGPGARKELLLGDFDELLVLGGIIGSEISFEGRVVLVTVDHPSHISLDDLEVCRLLHVGTHDLEVLF